MAQIFDNPSEQSIQAVLDPTANNYYYFVADTSTGKVYFAATSMMNIL